MNVIIMKKKKCNENENMKIIIIMNNEMWNEIMIIIM